jgi:hypothetical protein
MLIESICHMIVVIYKVTFGKKDKNDKKQKKNKPKIKIVVDNFQVLRAEFEDRFTNIKLKDVENAIRTKNAPAPASTTPDTSTLKEHEELFLQNLAALFNDATALQDSKISGD